MRGGAGAPALFVFPACGRSGSFPPPACWRREDFSLPRFRGEGRGGGMASHPGRLAVIAIVVLALLAAVGYTGYAGTTVYQQLDSGRQELLAAQAGFSAAAQSADPAQLRAPAAPLRVAERGFSAPGGRARNDPALRLLGRIPAAGRNLDAFAHLAAFGADRSGAGEAAAAVAIQVVGLKQQYAGR